MEASASVPMSFVSSSASAPNPSVPKSMLSALTRVPTSLTIPFNFPLMMFRYLDLDRYLDQLDMRQNKLLNCVNYLIIHRGI